MRVGILGCGYVGKAVANQWKQKGHLVSVTTRKAERRAELELIADSVFVIQNGHLKTFLEQQEIILISVAPDSSDYHATYLETARQVKEHLNSCACLKQIIYTSSASVYGERQGAWVDEDSPLRPSRFETSILVETEKALLSCQSDRRKVCILRLGGIYGPGREMHKRLLQMQGRPFPGNGESFTNLIHLQDIVKAIDFSLEHQLNGIYNVCQDDHPLRKDLYNQLSLQYSLSPVQWDPQIESLHGGNKRVSNRKLKDLGFIFEGKVV